MLLVQGQYGVYGIWVGQYDKGRAQRALAEAEGAAVLYGPLLQRSEGGGGGER